jgi:ribonuclease VapC
MQTIGLPTTLSATTSTACPASRSFVVIDTSALIALLSMEPEAPRIAGALESEPDRLISAATLVEVSIVIEARYGPAGTRELDLLLAKAGFVVEPVTSEQADIAREAWRRYGKGRHSAALNFGDCFSYALTKAKGESLLFKGQDFTSTDIAVAPY